MNIWNKLKDNAHVYGIWECGHYNRDKRKSPGQRNPWNYRDRRRRRFGKHFYSTLKLIPEGKSRVVILSLLNQYQVNGRLTEKQWRLLGVHMTKADPSCVKNPKVKEKQKVVDLETSVIVRKRKSI